jgi:hypothetical protein
MTKEEFRKKLAKIPRLIHCPACEGCGLVEMPKELATTLRFVENRNGTTAADCAVAFRKSESVGVTAYNNRLTKLWKSEWLERRKIGRAWSYQLTLRKARLEKRP